MELKKLTRKTDSRQGGWINGFHQVNAFRRGPLNNHELVAIRTAHSKDLLLFHEFYSTDSMYQLRDGCDCSNSSFN